jgi:hypothetical protein
VESTNDGASSRTIDDDDGDGDDDNGDGGSNARRISGMAGANTIDDGRSTTHLGSPGSNGLDRRLEWISIITWNFIRVCVFGTHLAFEPPPNPPPGKDATLERRLTSYLAYVRHFSFHSEFPLRFHR